MTPEFLMTSLIVVLLPGTGVIFTISTGLLQGARASVFAALGCTAGIVPHIAASLLGLAAVLHTSALAFQLVKFAGVIYLLFMAWSMWRETGGLTVNEQVDSTTAFRTARRSFLINILNPKLSLFFLAFLPQFVPANSAQAMTDMLLLSGVFMLMTLIVFIGYGILANLVRRHVIDSPLVQRRVQRSFAVVFAALGIRLALSERTG